MLGTREIEALFGEWRGQKVGSFVLVKDGEPQINTNNGHEFQAFREIETLGIGPRRSWPTWESMVVFQARVSRRLGGTR